MLIAAFLSNNMQAYGKRQPKAKVSSDSTAVADNEMSVMLKNITVTLRVALRVRLLSQ